MEKNKKGSLLPFLVICYGVAFIASLFTWPQIAGWYAHLAKPNWGPRTWLFLPLRAVLYGMLAVAGWEIWCSADSKLRTAVLWAFGIPAGLNYAWSPIFFSLQGMVAEFSIVVCLWAFFLLFMVLTSRFQRPSAALFVPYLLLVSFAATLNYTIWTMNPNPRAGVKHALTAVALRLEENTDEHGFPAANSWNKTSAISFDHDWKGENPTPALATEVRLLWTRETLFVKFLSSYQSLNVYPDARNDGWRDQLWDRDVAETFLQPDGSEPLQYKEFEVGPNGFWIALDISHGTKAELKSGLKRRVMLNEMGKTWTAELAIPMRSLTTNFDPKRDWRVNFYRVEGPAEPRFYSAWSPTRTAEPNFHVPSEFGTLTFR